MGNWNSPNHALNVVPPSHLLVEGVSHIDMPKPLFVSPSDLAEDPPARTHASTRTHISHPPPPPGDFGERYLYLLYGPTPPFTNPPECIRLPHLHCPQPQLYFQNHDPPISQLGAWGSAVGFSSPRVVQDVAWGSGGVCGGLGRSAGRGGLARRGGCLYRLGERDGDGGS